MSLSSITEDYHLTQIIYYLKDTKKSNKQNLFMKISSLKIVNNQLSMLGIKFLVTETKINLQILIIKNKTFLMFYKFLTQFYSNIPCLVSILSNQKLLKSSVP